jgi:serine protease Do
MKSLSGFGVILLTCSLTAVIQCVEASAESYRGQRGTVSHGPAGPAQQASQGYLGVDLRDVNEEEISALKLKGPRGAEIIRVDHDGPAGKMGLRERDVVVTMNGIAVEGEEHIRRMLRETAPGHTVVLAISRDGQTLTMTGQMGDRAQIEREAWEMHLTISNASSFGPQAPQTGLPSDESSAADTPPPASGPAPSSRYSKGFLGTLLMTPSYTGLMLERMGVQLADFFGLHGANGLLVRSVDNNSPAAMAGIKAGDVLVRANARSVANLTDWAKAIRDAKGRPVTVVVLRDRQEKTLTLTPDAKKRSGLEPPPVLPDAAPDSFDSAVLACRMAL